MNYTEMLFNRDERLVNLLNQADSKNLELIEEINNREDEIKQLRLELLGYRQAILQDKEMLGLKQEIERLNNIINRARRRLGEYKYYSAPTEEQNKENEDISEEVYQILHENLYELQRSDKE